MPTWDDYTNQRDQARTAHASVVGSFDRQLEAGRMTDAEHTAAVARANQGLQTRMAELRNEFEAAQAGDESATSGWTTTTTSQGCGLCGLIVLAMGASAATALGLVGRALLG